MLRITKRVSYTCELFLDNIKPMESTRTSEFIGEVEIKPEILLEHPESCVEFAMKKFQSQEEETEAVVKDIKELAAILKTVNSKTIP